ncbi:MAG: acyl-CoA synthetase FdrA [Deltaproteobacteria bacterium]|nr:acyl-CoA synthetase FdrA [Deltaproteobacteria bacterium]
MITRCLIRKKEYYDSVFLMRVAKQIAGQRGILQAATLMGTEKNKVLLADIGFESVEISSATPNDLIIAIRAENETILSNTIENIDQWLNQGVGETGALSYRTIEEAVTHLPRFNLAVISVPGQYADREARKALEQGLNVFLFSDNVPVESELSLKEFAREKGLILMGPDCGTAIINGIGIGFANRVRRGPIGVIGSSGTGLQEFTTLVHRFGSGISHAIGTGGRDLSDQVGGITFLSAMDALESDRETKVIALLSKPPGSSALEKLIQKIQLCRKPVIACFLGLKYQPTHEPIGCKLVRTIDEAASLSVQLATGNLPSLSEKSQQKLEERIRQHRSGKKSEQKYIRGIFAGGTFCYQAQQILQDAGIFVHSNAPLQNNPKLKDPMHSTEHTLVDMGSDEFTVGRPHPMIDSGLRYERILTEAKDPQVSILLLDFILGFNASLDPAGELLPAIDEAISEAKKRGESLTVVASVCGTEQDPQDFNLQFKKLEGAGVFVFSNSAQAARFCGLLITGGS